MIFISHRGNLHGKGGNEWENHPDYIQTALDEGYNVEIDVWIIDDKIYLGHDKPQYEINFRWIRDRITRLWIHCKNIESIIFFKRCGYIVNYFWHQNDDYTLTSKEYIWTYPNKPIVENCIAVLPELYPDWDISKAIGICSDYISRYKQ